MGSVLALCLANSANSQESAAATNSARSVDGANPHDFTGRGNPHMLPLRDPALVPGQALITAAAATKKLTYYGGPVIQNVHVVPVYWNSKVQFQANLNAFYAAVSTGPYMNFLSQYKTAKPAQVVAGGNAVPGLVDTQTATALTDVQIQAYLVAAFNSGKLPKPTANNLYPVHFPAGVSITQGTSKSCVQFCAYHGTGVYNGQNFYYGVLPDLGQAGCSAGCGASSVVNNTTSVASHEFAEAVTDPAVGLATVYAAPLAWYNATYGEIGDICNGQQATATLADGKVYTVQKEWSNATSTCVVPTSLVALAALGAPSTTFALAATSVTLPGHATLSTHVTVTNWLDSDKPVTLSASGLPAGMTVNFWPATVALPGSGSAASSMNVTTAGTKPGSYVLTINAADGIGESDTTVLVTVK
jgi:hypothetical protein